jgi:hypothetical protein
VTGTELRTLCQTRATHHRKRADEYSQQAAMFPDDAQNPMGGNSNTSSPRKALADKAVEHSDAANKIEFIGSHVVDAETYRLSSNDLATLGITKRAY